MNDLITIRQLRIETLIGLYPWEKQVRQTLLVDIDLSVDIRAAADQDDLTKTINYEAVCQQLISLATTEQFNLIETLAERMAGLILDSSGSRG